MAPHKASIPVSEALSLSAIPGSGIVVEPLYWPGMRWVAVDQCPACGAEGGPAEGRFPDRDYVYGERRVRLPEGGIAICRCRDCGLAYKSLLPHPDDLLEVFRAKAEKVWSGAQGFEAELNRFERFAGSTDFDLLDVGAADGALLSARARRNPHGRRAALDLLCYGGLRDALSGEFIEGFLDAPELKWSAEPYAIVSLLDVAEHLYRPEFAFANLAKLVARGGHVLIESGDTASSWARRYGLPNWWYARLLEHHVFWSREPMERIAAAHGFEVVDWSTSRHRRDLGSRRSRVTWKLLKALAYQLAPKQYARIANRFGRQGNQPCHPFAKDHFICALKKL